MRYLLRYNDQDHRSEKHSRLQDWLANLPPDGLRDMWTRENSLNALPSRLFANTPYLA